MSLYSSNSKVKFLVQAALIAAAYTALTYSGFAFAYGPIQFRYSEALIAFAALTPAAVPGLTIGCVLSNLGSAQLGIYDIVFGSLATLLAALFAYLFRKIRVRGMPLLSLAGNVVFLCFYYCGHDRACRRDAGAVLDQCCPDLHLGAGCDLRAWASALFAYGQAESEIPYVLKPFLHFSLPEPRFVVRLHRAVNPHRIQLPAVSGVPV